MAITKRTRFEILRRDEHTCQYCGEKAPDVILHIDHIIPVALGGSDDPSNLVTACKDCNAGKSSISPDSPVVAAVSARSAEYALANANRNAHIEADMLATKEYQDAFSDVWERFTYRRGIKDLPIPLPDAWRSTLAMWWKTGVPKSLIESAARNAMGANHVDIDDRFRYFAGIVWRTLDDYDQRYSEQTEKGRVYSESEMEERSVDEWRRGWVHGELSGARVIKGGDLLRHHIDGTSPSVGYGWKHYGELVG